MLYRMAAKGWVCVSATYRLRGSTHTERLADARAVVAWVKENAHVYGGDPTTVFLVGGSAGAHLAGSAALSGTDVRGVVGLYGYYRPVDTTEDEPASPHELLHPGAPPFLVVHGTLDTLVLVRDARRFATRLREFSAQPVAHAELPGAHHSFDLSPPCAATRSSTASNASRIWCETPRASRRRSAPAGREAFVSTAAGTSS